MKKSNLWTGLSMTALGILFLLAALLWDTPLDSILCGLSGAFAASGVVQVCKYVKWSSPKNAPLYRERLEQEQIDLRDERKEMLRNKSGRYAYILVLLLTAAAVLGFSVLGQLGLMEGGAARLLTIFLGAFLVVQYAAGIIIYKLLERKY